MDDKLKRIHLEPPLAYSNHLKILIVDGRGERTARVTYATLTAWDTWSKSASTSQTARRRWVWHWQTSDYSLSLR